VHGLAWQAGWRHSCGVGGVWRVECAVCGCESPHVWQTSNSVPHAPHATPTHSRNPVHRPSLTPPTLHACVPPLSFPYSLTLRCSCHPRLSACYVYHSQSKAQGGVGAEAEEGERSGPWCSHGERQHRQGSSVEQGECSASCYATAYLCCSGKSQAIRGTEEATVCRAAKGDQDDQQTD
jgi:hypothetical protein